MKVSILVSDLSANSLVRTAPIASVLQRRYEVEIIGPAMAGNVYPPCRGLFDYQSIAFPPAWWRTRIRRRVATIPKSLRHSVRKAEGDVIYAFKPKLCSLGAGLLARKQGKRPLLLDIEDWDADFYHSAPMRARLRKLCELGDPRNFHYDHWMERLTQKADRRTVISTFLQKRYGGTLLPNGPDCTFFDPARCDGDMLRNEWGLANKFLILFTGSAAPHKGLGDLAEAIDRIQDGHTRLLVVGPKTRCVDAALRDHPEAVLHLPPQPQVEMPRYLASANAVVLPQRDTRYARAQVPAKLYEAMAMAKPIIATAVSDLPTLLDGCGRVVPAGDIDALAAAIEDTRSRPEQSRALGQAARRKCMAHYGWDAMDRILHSIMAEYE